MLRIIADKGLERNLGEPVIVDTRGAKFAGIIATCKAHSLLEKQVLCITTTSSSLSVNYIPRDEDILKIGDNKRKYTYRKRGYAPNPLGRF